MHKVSKSASELKDIIKKAINDLEITPDEYDEIMNFVHSHDSLGKEDHVLLSHFHAMISDGTLKRVRK